MNKLFFLLFVNALVELANAQLLDGFASGTTRCDFLCQNDDSCRSGRCVLTSCIDTASCFRYCFYCNYGEKCYEAGKHCYVYHSAQTMSHSIRPSVNGFVTKAITVMSLLFLV